MVYHEKPVKRIKECVLCLGEGKLQSSYGDGACWHCHGTGKTMYTYIEGGWLHCYCKIEPRC